MAAKKVKKMRLKPIGIIHSPYKNRKESQPQGREEICWIEVSEQYAEGLKDIDGFSHLILLYWFHQGNDYTLLVKAPWSPELHGLFSTRSPDRPNSLGFAVVELIDSKANVRVGWVKETDFSKIYGKLLKEPKNVQ
jgi:tRNA-Thr(GGU) m(6)t(6)A37 methyltransferase TsaA